MKPLVFDEHIEAQCSSDGVYCCYRLLLEFDRAENGPMKSADSVQKAIAAQTAAVDSRTERAGPPGVQKTSELMSWVSRTESSTEGSVSGLESLWKPYVRALA